MEEYEDKRCGDCKEKCKFYFRAINNGNIPFGCSKPIEKYKRQRMMNCKDCIHSGLCYKENDYDNFPDRCGSFVPDRPQGEWIYDTEHSITIDMYKCSVCGCDGHTHFKFCPNCGADMRPKPNHLRDCENCIHHSDNGCEVWECEFEKRSDV